MDVGAGENSDHPLDQFQAVLTQAGTHRGSILNVPWVTQQDRELLLSVKCPINSQAAEWKLFRNGGMDLLWTETTNDSTLVFRRVAVSLGKPDLAMAAPSKLRSLGPRSPRSTGSMESPANPRNTGGNLFPPKVKTTGTNMLASPPRSTGSNLKPIGPRSTGSGMTALSPRVPYPGAGSSIENFAPPGDVSDVPTSIAPIEEQGPVSELWPGIPLKGDLAYLQPANLMQFLFQSKLIGRLRFIGPRGTSDVYFESGLVTHSYNGTLSGAESFYEVLEWEEGTYQFEVGVRVERRTIQSNFDALLGYGLNVVTHMKYVQGFNVYSSSVLARKTPNLSEQEFETQILTGTPIDLSVQKEFYLAIDGAKSVGQIATAMRLQRSIWIGVLANLLKCDLISVSSQTPKTSRMISALTHKQINRQVIDQLKEKMINPQTGLYSYAAFLLFLDQELNRANIKSNPVSILLFEICRRKTGLTVIREPLPEKSLAEVLGRIDKLKRRADLFTHYETAEYALVCAETSADQAQVLAKQIVASLADYKLEHTDGAKDIVVDAAIGVASSDDAGDLNVLLSAAEFARQKAVQVGQNVILFKEIN